ncbi:MAG: RluA family pseudouridine synthase, partial [Betaproteobacteria bacterium]|nr:RluA family pseudouridine synthase [Betaproteobacteria bacterium]
ALKNLHTQIRNNQTKKIYLALVPGQWDQKISKVDLALRKYVSKAGERRVVIDGANGKPSLTLFKALEVNEQTSLIEANLKTGRTHQIRVHLAHINFPILGDDKYGDFRRNKLFQKYDLKRMFLHAHRFSFTHPKSSEKITIESPLPVELREVMRSIDGAQSNQKQNN